MDVYVDDLYAVMRKTVPHALVLRMDDRRKNGVGCIPYVRMVNTLAISNVKEMQIIIIVSTNLVHKDTY